ncbi:MAG: hypothetical protein WC455_16380 [Dehalococcoidia bacterium]|jgi:Tfp pilus assembly protein PilE
MIIEIVAVLVLIAVISFQAWEKATMRREFSKEKADLLNRLMARNYETYVQAEVLRQPPRPLTDEEIYEQQQERGIPV